MYIHVSRMGGEERFFKWLPYGVNVLMSENLSCTAALYIVKLA